MDDAIKSTDRFLARNDVAIASNVVVEKVLCCEYIHWAMWWILICIRISWLENIKWSFDVIYVCVYRVFRNFPNKLQRYNLRAKIRKERCTKFRYRRFNIKLWATSTIHEQAIIGSSIHLPLTRNSRLTIVLFVRHCFVFFVFMVSRCIRVQIS